MPQIKALALNRAQIISLTKFASLLALAIAAPIIGEQSITGTIVNAVLFITVALLGLKSALAIAVLPSLFALAFGTLPKPLAIFIPFIITSNALLCLVFYKLKNINFGLAMISSSIIKFLFLLGWSQLLFNVLMPSKLSPKILLMMSWPQLYTALLGGVAAWFILRLTRKS